MRQQILQHAVDQITSQPWQRYYRKKLSGSILAGWPLRLYKYSWATKQTPDLTSHLIWLDKISNQAAKSSLTSTNAHATATAILEWGGVTRGNSAKVSTCLAHVVQSSRTGAIVGGAPMNSGWTKIAAIFSLNVPNVPPQIIWDSRVSLSVCTRIGSASQAFGITPDQLQYIFPNLGWVTGRGGNRPQLQKRAQSFFPNRYRKWSAHFEGGRVVQEMTNILNQNISHYGRPSAALSSSDLHELRSNHVPIPHAWNSWLVACVLFMDGQ
jgi:hypothetical protein